MKILAIDTSCDETSVAVTEGVKVLSNVVSSQVRFHKKYGGVVPFLAQRLHQERIDSVVELALQRAGATSNEIEAVAVTYGPGLAPALQVGVAKAKELAQEWHLPLYAVDHMAGHFASCLAQVGNRTKTEVQWPVLAVLASGNHTELVLAEQFGKFQVLGQTLDDALGEAYDKVGRMLGLGYPGGRLVALFAEEGNSERYPLPIPMQHSKDLNMSYSGLKNAVRLLVEKEQPLTREKIKDISASFERVAQASLLLKITKVLKEYEVSSLFLAGGVSANNQLRKSLRSLVGKNGLVLHTPANLKLCSDNAAMIGVAAFLGIKAGQKPVDPTVLDRKPSLTLDESSILS